MKYFRGTKHHKKFWEERQVDWEKDYLDTWKHPHRFAISEILSTFYWLLMVEVGCGSGPNLVNINKHFPGRQVGGVDVNKDAIELAAKTLQGAHLKVSSVEDIMMSDNSADLVLSDMTMIYVSNPDKAIREIKRITRRHVLFCELHSNSWWGRMKLRYTSGYHAHNYKRLLTKHGFKDIIIVKFPSGTWPGGNPQKDYGYFIKARKPKR